MKNVLVLGSAGQIGTPLVSSLKSQNYIVTEFDIEDDVCQDLRIPHKIDDILKYMDFVFFLAFDVGGAIYLDKHQDSYDFISNNMKIMMNTFDSLKEYKIPFLFASSQMANLNNSSYGILKNIGEKYTNSFDLGKIIRLWNVYGIEKNPDKSHVITDFILMAKSDNIIRIRTSGEEKRQFLYSVDCSECLISIMEKFNDIYEKKLEVSNFEWTSIYEIAEIIAKEMRTSKIIRGNLIDNVQREKLGEPETNILKYWSPQTAVIDGIKNIINHNLKK